MMGSVDDPISLGYRALDRYADGQRPADLDAAISALRQGLESDIRVDPDFAQTLANAHEVRYGNTGNEPDLDAAIDLRRRVIRESPLDDGAAADHHGYLAASLVRRFDDGDDPADIAEALTRAREAVRLSTTDSQAADHAHG